MFYEVAILINNKLIKRFLNFSLIVGYEYETTGFYKVYYHNKFFLVDKASFENALKKLKLI